MKQKTKKWWSLCAGIIGVSVIVCGAGIGIVSCSSTNSSTTTSPNPTNSTSSSSSTASSSSTSSNKTTSSTDSNKTTSTSSKDTKSTTSSSSPTTVPPANTSGLVTLNTFLTTPTTKQAVGQLISTNVYACGSKITLNANYIPPPHVTSGSDETDTITYAWYAGDDLIAGQVNSQCNIAGIFSTTTYKVVVTCQVYKESKSTTSSTSSKDSQSSSNTNSSTGASSSSSSASDKNTQSTTKTSSSSSSSTTTSSSKTTTIVLAGDTTKTQGATSDNGSSSSSDDSGSKSTTTKPTTTKTLIKTYTCNTTLTVTVDYSNLSATLVYGANQMGTITSNAQTALAVNLQYKFEGNGTTQPAGALYSFSTTDLKKLPASTISFERYSFGKWQQINAANTSANSIENLDYSYTPTGIYPIRAQLNIGSSVLTSNMLKVNTTYDGSVLDLNTISTSLQSTYSYTSLMLLYLQQSLKEDGNNAPFMQLVNSWGQGYIFIEATTGDSYNPVSATDLTDFNVSWVNPKDHSDGLIVNATVNVANNKGLELLGYSNYQNKDYAYTTSNNLLIPNGDVISWTLPFGGMQALRWTVSNGQVSSVNWNITNYPNNVFYNYGSTTSPSWHAYDWACTNQYGYPSIASSNVYWGYKVTTSNGQNALTSLISNNNFYTKLKPTDTSYLLYNDFPMVSTNSSNMQVGYITLTSQCVSLLNTLYQESIAGIAALENN